MALRIGENLDFDVARAVDEFLDVDAGILERGFGFVPALWNDEANAASSRTTRIPLPPPPAAALMSTGKPMPTAIRCASATSATGPSEPGTHGTLAAAATAFASVFRPILRIASWGGPMNSKLQLRQISAKCGFSLRKP